jgi:hypothetical protein
MQTKVKYLLLGFTLASVVAFAQSETFDLVTFTPPTGWKRESNNSAVSYVITNEVSRGWCRVTIFKSIGSSGNLNTDFDHEWNELITKPYSGTVKPKQDVTEDSGWTAQSGASGFTFQGEQCYALLTAISGYGKALSITVIMNSQEYKREVELFLSSVELKKPEISTVVQPASVSSNQTTVGVTPITVKEAPGNQGITLATTNFDDGWISHPFADYVKVTKNNTVVLLHYAIEITDEMRNNSNMEGILFDRFILPRYNVSNIRKYDHGGPCYFCIYFFEADAIEKATGKRVHIGFRVIPNNGIARCIEIISPSQDDFQQTFPTQEKVEAMLNYNKFAVTLKDIVGTWEESSGSYVNMYSTITGAYAGMNTASSAHKFMFSADGTYKSEHSGAHGMVGSMQFFSQKYSGKATVTNWDITLPNRFKGETDILWAQFEAVRGGRVLHLVEKDSPVMDYHLVKTQ